MITVDYHGEQIMQYRKTLKIIDNLDKTIVDFVINEKTNTEMAKVTGYSLGYIKKRLGYLFRLFGVKSKVGLVRELLRIDRSLLDT